MSNPHVSLPLDPDPAEPYRIVTEVRLAALQDEAWEEGYAAAESDRRYRVIGLVLAALSGAIVAAFITVAIVQAAAPRSAQLAIPAAVIEGGASGTDAGQIGAPRSGMAIKVPRAEATREDPAPAGRVGAPPSPDLGTAIASGIVAYADRSFGDRYLAIPGGPGTLVRICAGSGTVSRCLDRASTDAGPALFRQREGRIADVSFVDFAWLCRCDPPDVGTMVATIEWIGPGLTPPPTDVEP